MQCMVFNERFTYPLFWALNELKGGYRFFFKDGPKLEKKKIEHLVGYQANTIEKRSSFFILF